MQNHAEKIKAGLVQAAVRGRKPGRPRKVTDAQIMASIHLGTVKGAAFVGLSVSNYIRRRRVIEQGAENA